MALRPAPQSDCPPASPDVTLVYDEDGNLLSQGGPGVSPGLKFTWDAENRLAAVEPNAPAAARDASDVKLVFTYDYRGRRVEKKVFGWDDTNDVWESTPDVDLKFVYDDWLPILVLDGLDDDAVLREFTWGLDIAGQNGNVAAAPRGGRPEGVAQPPSASVAQPPSAVSSLEGAGGIGGLVATRDEDAGVSYVDFYDGNGNVTQMINRSDDSTAAKYEYDAYGNNLLDSSDPNQSGPYAATNALRFSTKWWDNETELGYWGYRYYSAEIGRWLSRDPGEEESDVLLARYSANNPVSLIDYLGLYIPGVQWRVTISPRSQLDIDAQIVVKYPCCECAFVTFVQIVTEYAVYGGVGFPAEGIDIGEDGLNWNPMGHSALFYPHVERTKDDVRSRPCTKTAVFTDSPGIHWGSGKVNGTAHAIRQDFETCAICMRGGGGSCVLGCVWWGHLSEYRKGKIVHEIYGDGAEPQGPSATMMRILGKTGAPYDGECNSCGN